MIELNIIARAKMYNNIITAEAKRKNSNKIHVIIYIIIKKRIYIYNLENYSFC